MELEVLHTIRPFFEKGYRPARGTESYARYTAGYNRAFQNVNCFSHILNLRNEQLKDSNLPICHPLYITHNLTPRRVKYTKAEIFKLFHELDLSIEECAPAQEINDFKSWKCAMYYNDSDYHFLLEEAPGIWSSKVGFSPYLEHIYMKEPPEVYAPIICRDMQYQLYNTYKITNHNADINNEYVQGFEQRLNIPDEQKKLKHCIIEGKYAKEQLCTEKPVLTLFDF